MSFILLFLNLILLGVVKPQEEDFDLTVLPTSRPIKPVPVQPYFQTDKFQGKWYIIALADRRILNGKRKKSTMESITYGLKADNSLVSITTMSSPLGCDRWTRVYLPTTLPGIFTQNIISGNPGEDRFTMRVAHTDYNQFAVVSFTEYTNDKVYFSLNLYGRTKELSPRLKRHFLQFADYLGFSQRNVVFHIPTEKCIDN